ncbi:MAG: 6-phosphofructokinase [bacterium]|nr:6-phosphofructokinase [bacterium]
MKSRRVGIIVGGGPAPGINAVIGAATIEAINQGFEVIAFYDGFEWLSSDDFDPAVHSIRLDIATVARIHFRGGSMLRTSRISLLNEERLRTHTRVAPDEAKVNRVIQHLTLLGIGNLITIGGDDTALSARFVCEGASGAIRLAHVPKTIDNDLPLPEDIVTFGFSTARYMGAQIIKNLMQDSRTTGRWYLVTAMGRKAGWLAMGIGQSAGATMMVIPEEFADNIRLKAIADVLEGAMLKRRVMGRNDGVALLAEGLAYRLGDREELEQLLGKEVAVDAAGHVRLSEVPLGDMLAAELVSRFKARGESVTIVSHELGYELRSADPTPGDMAYCRSLGHGAVRLLLDTARQSPGGVLVSIVSGNLVPLELTDLADPETNRTQTRVVDTCTYTYQVGRAYQIRLERSDLDNPTMLAKLAKEAHTPPDEFRERFLQAATRLHDQQMPVG